MSRSLIKTYKNQIIKFAVALLLLCQFIANVHALEYHLEQEQGFCAICMIHSEHSHLDYVTIQTDGNNTTQDINLYPACNGFTTNTQSTLSIRSPPSQ